MRTRFRHLLVALLLVLAVAPASAQTTVFQDSFYDTSGTLLTAHTPTVIGTNAPTSYGVWKTNPTAGSTACVISPSLSARTNTGSANSAVEDSVTPGTAAYTVMCNWLVYSAPATNLYDELQADVGQTGSYAQCYAIQYTSGSLKLIKLYGGSATTIGSSISVTLTTGGGSSSLYSLALTVGTGATPTISASIENNSGQYLNSSGTWQSGATSFATGTDSSNVLGAGPGGIFFYDTQHSDTSGIQMQDFQIQTAGTGSLNLGTLAVTSSSPSGVNLSIGAASGGTSPYTYAFYRSTYPTFTPPGAGMLISSGSSTTCTDTTAASKTPYWYVCYVTDSTTLNGVSNQVPADLWPPALKLGLVGDSNLAGGYGVTPVAEMTQRLEALAGIRVVTITNEAVAGSATGNWVSGQTDMTNALAAFSSAGVTVVLDCLGTNDAVAGVSESTYASNQSNICSTLHDAGYTVILLSPPSFGSAATYYTGTDENLLLSYGQTAISGLVNGSTILNGDYGQIFLSTLNNPTNYQSDGVHYDTTNATLVGDIVAHGVLKALYPNTVTTNASVPSIF